MKKSVFAVFLAVLVLPFAAADADFAVYTGSGTWGPSIDAFTNFLEWKGLTWEAVNKNTINGGGLIGHYQGLFMPGGWAGDYNRDIKVSGDQHIRDFISQGGAYIGMSAGAFYACDVTVWEGDNLNYPSDIFDGDCIGPIDEIAPWPEYTMTTMDINLAHEANVYEPAQRDVLYYGEPYFVANPGQEMQVFASWIVPTNPVVNGKPGIIGFNYGSGRVVLVGPHPEIEEDDSRDGNNFGEELSDGPDGSDWPFLWTAVDWMLDNPISLPPGVTPPVPPACNDALDNDFDGLIDFPADDGCDSLNDATEEIVVVMACADGLDNDSDGFVDLSDAGCESASDDDEFNVVTGPVDLFFDTFEDGDLNGWVRTQPGGGSAWINENDFPAFGTRHAFCKPQDTSNPASVMTASVSTAGHDSVEVSYYRRVNGLDAVDWFSASWTDGNAWYPLENVNSQTDSSYVFRSFTLPSSAANNPAFGIRFACTAGAVSEWCSVDDVWIVGA